MTDVQKLVPCPAGHTWKVEYSSLHNTRVGRIIISGSAHLSSSMPELGVCHSEETKMYTLRGKEICNKIQQLKKPI